MHPPGLFLLLHYLTFIRRCTFSLKTLYLSEDFELFPWILNQTELEIIAVYNPKYFWGNDKDRHLSYQRWLSSSPCFRVPPTLFIISGASYWKDMDVISAFPAFSPGLSAKLIDDSLKYFDAFPETIILLGLYVQTMDELYASFWHLSESEHIDTT